MESNWAAEHLQVIRTLMERSAIYRRALAPIMTFSGGVGLAGALAGWQMKIHSPRAYILFWAAMAAIALVGSFLLVRRQALKESEPFWSPPTRRVSQAMLPALTAGCILGAIVFFKVADENSELSQLAVLTWLPQLWVVLYGCALCAAGFFTTRGIKLFGWCFILGGCALFALPDADWRRECPHGVMGFFFGALHLAYGVYLYFTEKGKNAA